MHFKVAVASASTQQCVKLLVWRAGTSHPPATTAWSLCGTPFHQSTRIPNGPFQQRPRRILRIRAGTWRRPATTAWCPCGTRTTWSMSPHASQTGRSTSAHVTNIAHPRRYLASAGNDGLVSLWDTDDMVCLRTYARPDWSVRSLSFSHDARWLAYASEDSGGTIDIVGVQGGASGWEGRWGGGGGGWPCCAMMLYGRCWNGPLATARRPMQCVAVRPALAAATACERVSVGVQ